MLNGTKCDGGQVPFGPYDYLQRDRLKSQLEVVEESHFNKDVESLTKGMTATAMGDIHYTLQTWPNHHRALKSAVQFRLRNREMWDKGDNTAQNYPAECYLQRAIKFSPNDPVPYMLHGMLMHQMKQFEKALKSYRQAIRLQPTDLVTQYNMGLTLVELKQLKEAQQIADKVYAAEFPLPGLKRKLAEAKQQKAKVANDQKQKQSTPPAAASKTVPQLTPEQTVELQKAMKAEAAKKSSSGLEATGGQEAPVVPSQAKDQAKSPAEAAATTPPQLTAEQSAELQKAMKAEAAKKNAASGGNP